MKLYPFALVLAFPALAAAQTLTGPLPPALAAWAPVRASKPLHPPLPPVPPPAWAALGPAHPGAAQLRAPAAPAASATSKVTK